MATNWEPNGFRIVRELGRGAMGIVYEAVDLGLSRPVAIKAFSPELASDPGLIRRFEREAKAVAAITHPNVVTVHSIGKADDTHFIVMEFVAGQTLADFTIDHGAIPVTEAIEIAMQICAGVGAAHERKLIHRDIKPHNILISPDGRVKVTDFGLVGMAEGLTDLSMDGVKVGTPRYMAPETCRGERATFQTDIYGIGAVLYELLTGSPAFHGDNVLSVMKNIEAGEFPTLEYAMDHPPAGLSELVATATHADPAARFSTCAEFSAALRAWVHGTDSPTLVLTPYLDSDGPDSDRAIPIEDPEAGSYDVAVVCHSGDLKWARRLMEFLGRSGYKAHTVQIDHGSELEDNRQLLEDCKCVALLLSSRLDDWAQPDALSSIQDIGEKTVPIFLDRSKGLETFDSPEAVYIYALDESEQVSQILQTVEIRVERSHVPDSDQTKIVKPFADTLDEGPRRPVDPVSNLPPSALSGIPGTAEFTAQLESRLEGEGVELTAAMHSSFQEIAARASTAQLASRRRYTYDMLWWIDAPNSITLAMEFAQLADKIPLDIEPGAGVRDRLMSLREWLSAAKHWLIVVSGTTSRDALLAYIPAEHSGQVLMVSTAQEARDAPARIGMESCTADTVAAAFRNAQIDIDNADARELHDLFKDNAVCYFLAARYLIAFEEDPESFADNITKCIEILEDRYPDWDPERLRLMSMLTLILERLSGWSPDARELLRLLTLLKGTSMSVTTIAWIAASDQRKGERLRDTKVVSECLSILETLGLITKSGKKFRMETAVSECLAEWADATVDLTRGTMRRLLRSSRSVNSDGIEWANSALNLVLKTISTELATPEGWDRWVYELPHFHAMLQRYNDFGLRPEVRMKAWEELARSYADHGLFEYACGAYRRAISLTIRELGASAPVLCRLYLGLADAYNRRGDHTRALVSLTEALPLWDDLPASARDDEYVMTIASLAESTLQSGDIQGAQSTWKRAAKFSLGLPQKASPRRVGLHEKLGDLAVQMNDVKSGIHHFAVALAASDALPEDQRNASRRLLRKLVANYRSSGDPDCAIPYGKRVVAETKERYGPDHRRVLKDQYAYAMSLAESGHIEDAVAELKHTRDLAAKVYGKKHREYALIVFNLGTYLHRSRRLSEAAECYETALALFRKLLPSGHHYARTAEKSLQRVKELRKSRRQ